MASPELLATLGKIQKSVARAAVLLAMTSAVGAAALVYMVHKDATPEGQANIEAREKTLRILAQELTKREDLAVQKDRVALERQKFEASQQGDPK